ncbi:TetR/AcrR family transcriptional regulator [Brevibacillus centrosporus]|uniref:Transcriptional regulator, TetR family n=1 Tax=Brevibacillus centrosporus TaxID=54910 RepID=A0A1I3VHD6_9BACL|nr:TetR/AcrR family transcriptional regulator [Brevibacillus centrosporus]MEC2130863.1 TetR/AcrR family transcriptional regulator [Brevibacillus centrosporus]MED1953411.1 TetR/AcrR family transcriptional regulator [Brevibacillus centrosporus]MED4908040.1 TetR/AcrR family transcriptional regulator [Brevibacillus centrosporus]RNB69118.1 TetR/AcrR family transcriptional regulator [Brevibacillus centrosporus]SFJ94570.1 transcriptional regulator, TetR family [Brevibacillus centrosporus]
MTTRRERKKRETREKIFNAAIKLFKTHGFEGTTIDMISEEADVARGTIFLHFTSKEAILANWGYERLQQIEERREEWDYDDNCKAKVLRIYKIMNEVTITNFDFIKVVVESSMKHRKVLENEKNVYFELRQLFADLIEEAQEKKQLKSKFNPLVAANMLENIYYNALYDWVRSEGAWALEEIMEEKVSIVFDGLIEETS